jgi:hypothetical protein
VVNRQKMENVGRKQRKLTENRESSGEKTQNPIVTAQSCLLKCIICKTTCFFVRYTCNAHATLTLRCTRHSGERDQLPIYWPLFRHRRVGEAGALLFFFFPITLKGSIGLRFDPAFIRRNSCKADSAQLFHSARYARFIFFRSCSTRLWHHRCLPHNPY